MLGTLPTAACYFFVYEGCKSRMEARGHKQVLHLPCNHGQAMLVDHALPS